MPNIKLMNNIPHYFALMRVDKPVGWLLLLWPTLWALWIASDGEPSGKLIWIFSLGVFLMRSAGCVINDYADRDIDPAVQRTEQRPLAAGILKPKQALALFALLGLCALCLLWMLPMRVWPWSIPAIILTVVYPYMKRFIQAPQLVLGMAFSFGMPMVYVAVGHSFDTVFWLLILTNMCWVMVFDTQYAMSDREDDLKVGVKSSAILFGKWDRHILGLLQVVVLLLLVILANLLSLGSSFFMSVLLVGVLFTYQQRLTAERNRQPCFQAFLNNAWVGAIVWFGLLASL